MANVVTGTDGVRGVAVAVAVIEQPTGRVCTVPGAALASPHGTAALRAEQLATEKIGLHIANIGTCAIGGAGRKNLLVDLLYRIK